MPTLDLDVTARSWAMFESNADVEIEILDEEDDQ